MYKKLTISLILILASLLSISACYLPIRNKINNLPENSRFIFLSKTGGNFNNLPILKVADTSDLNNKILNDILINSYASQSVTYYYFIQNYLLNTNQIPEIQPLYILTDGKKGGFARHGFYLIQNSDTIDKSNVYYIDYYKTNNRPENYFSSFTQIFPHEMGHIYYHLLSKTPSNNLPAGVDVHFSSIITDYRVAFNEGFAIHFENTARDFENNIELKKDIFADYKTKNQKLKRILKSYNRDFIFPFRLDYYRITAIMWYSKFESLKRKDWVKNNLFKYQNNTANFRNIEKSLFYRNSAFKLSSSSLRNYQQSLSTEGVVASFFYDMIKSKLSANYLPMSFYEDFLNYIPNISNPRCLFTPVDNEYLKIFSVMNKYLNNIELNTSPLVKFVEGYLCEFPEEKIVVMHLFKDATGHNLNSNIGPEIWMLNKKHKHGNILFDQFGGNKTKYYTFNLNTADRYDLLTFKTIKQKEADTIINYRNNHGFFTNLSEVNSINGLSAKTKKLLLSSAYDRKFINKVGQNNLSVNKLLITSFAHLFEQGLFYFLLFIIVYYLLLKGKNEVFKIFTIKYVIQKILKLYFLIFMGLLVVLFATEPLKIFLVISIIFIGIESLLYKRIKRRRDAFNTSFFIIVMIMLSIW